MYFVQFPHKKIPFMSIKSSPGKLLNKKFNICWAKQQLHLTCIGKSINLYLSIIFLLSHLKHRNSLIKVGHRLFQPCICTINCTATHIICQIIGLNASEGTNSKNMAWRFSSMTLMKWKPADSQQIEQPELAPTCLSMRPHPWKGKNWPVLDC